MEPVRLELADRGFHGIVQARAFGCWWATRGRLVFRRPEDGDWTLWAELPRDWPRDAFNWSRIAERAARADQAVLHPFGPDRALVIRGGKSYAVIAGEGRSLGTIQGDCPLRASVAVAPSGSVYFGEYFMNPQRVAVYVWRVSPGMDRLEVAYTFPAGVIRHVHGIQADPTHPGRLWVTTGDNNGECFLWWTDDEFRTLERVGAGGQSWRAVRIFFAGDYVVWFTDSNLEQNYLMSFERSSGTLREHQPMETSVWYGLQTTEGDLLAATTVEKGPAVHTSDATILASRNGFDWTRVRHFRKDPLQPRRLFKFGVVSFPSGEVSRDSFFVTGEGLWQLDGRSAAAKLTGDTVGPTS